MSPISSLSDSIDRMSNEGVKHRLKVKLDEDKPSEAFKQWLEQPGNVMRPDFACLHGLEAVLVQALERHIHKQRLDHNPMHSESACDLFKALRDVVETACKSNQARLYSKLLYGFLSGFVNTQSKPANHLIQDGLIAFVQQFSEHKHALVSLDHCAVITKTSLNQKDVQVFNINDGVVTRLNFENAMSKRPRSTEPFKYIVVDFSLNNMKIVEASIDSFHDYKSQVTKAGQTT